MFNQQHSCLRCFLKGYVPVRVRSDLGGENVAVWRYMISQYSGDESVVITGSSTHNERIERLWRGCVSKLFYDSLEEDHLLDPLNETDIFCLHYVYVPRCLQEFVSPGTITGYHQNTTEHHINCK